MPDWTLHKFEALPSTNTYARELLSYGNAQDGDVFQVEHQTAGRGRLAERVWLDEKGDALLMSIVLKNVQRNFVELAPYLAALSVSKAVRALLWEAKNEENLQRISLKWPNDVLLDGKKCCGILSEAVWNGEELRGIVVGIGLNVNQIEFEDTLKEKAISLRMATERVFVVDAVRDRILESLDAIIRRGKAAEEGNFKQEILSEVRKEFQWMSTLPPFQIRFVDGRALDGIRYEGIAEDGALLGRDRDGNVMSLYGGSLNLGSDQ